VAALRGSGSPVGAMACGGGCLVGGGGQRRWDGGLVGRQPEGCSSP
jgi:hypothetical protein